MKFNYYIIIFTLLAGILGVWVFKSKRLWIKVQPAQKKIKETTQSLMTLYHPINAAWVSQRERTRLKISEDAFIYGEIEFLPFLTILDKAQPRPGEIFYDLGSGSGRAVFAAAFHYDLTKACGIELLPALHALAVQQIKTAQITLNAKKNDFNRNCLRRLSCIEFVNQNFLECDFSDGDILFINATCLSYPAWEKLKEKLNYLKCGSRIIITTKKMPLDYFQLLHQSMTLMSWGFSSVSIYERLNN